jgi:hypothetical protein
MTKYVDFWGASLVAVILVMLETFGYDLLKSVSNVSWIVCFVLLLSTAAAAVLKYPLTAILLGIWTARYCYLMNYANVLGVRDFETRRRAAYVDAAIADPRFAPNETDVAMANGTLPFHPTRVLAPASVAGPLLLFPPTPEQLALISGSS